MIRDGKFDLQCDCLYSSIHFATMSDEVSNIKGGSLSPSIRLKTHHRPTKNHADGWVLPTTEKTWQTSEVGSKNHFTLARIELTDWICGINLLTCSRYTKHTKHNRANYLVDVGGYKAAEAPTEAVRLLIVLMKTSSNKVSELNSPLIEHKARYTKI